MRNEPSQLWLWFYSFLRYWLSYCFRVQYTNPTSHILTTFHKIEERGFFGGEEEVGLVPVIPLFRVDPNTTHLSPSDCMTLLSLVLTQNVASEYCFITGCLHPRIDLIAKLAHHLLTTY